MIKSFKYCRELSLKTRALLDKQKVVYQIVKITMKTQKTDECQFTDLFLSLHLY